jgi:protein TonB
MHRALGRPQGRQFWTSRSLAVAGIVAVHALMLGIALVQHATPVVSQAVLVAVSLDMTPRQVIAPPSKLPVKLEAPKLDVVPPPQLAIDVPPEAPAVLNIATSAPEEQPVAPAAEKRSHPDAPVLVSDVEYLRPPVPRYPVMARRAQQQGVVYVRVLVDEEGRARDVQVSRSSGFALLDEAARQCVRDALFKPYRQDGVARSVEVVVPVAFSLQRQVS